MNKEHQNLFKKLAASYLVKRDLTSNADKKKKLTFKYLATVQKIYDIQNGLLVQFPEKHMDDDLDTPLIHIYCALIKAEGIGINSLKKLSNDFIKWSTSRGFNYLHANEKEINDKIKEYFEFNFEKLPKKTQLYTIYSEMFRPIKRSIIAEFDKLLSANAKLKYEVVGSYRRNLPYSNDIDIIVKKPNLDEDLINNFKPIQIVGFYGDIKITDYFAHIVLKDLLKLKIVKDFISVGSNKITLIMKFAHRTMQLDIVITTKEEYIPTLIYFTGNKYYNIYLRKLCKSKGYSLSEHGLFKDNKKIKIDAKTEKEFIKKLSEIIKIEIKYLNPDNRSLSKYSI